MSIHLPIDQRRTCLSAVEQLSSRYSELAEYAKSGSKSTDFIIKSDAIEKIQWFADLFTNKLDRYLNHEEEVRISAKLDVISKEVISQLKDNQLKSDLLDRIDGMFKKNIYSIFCLKILLLSQQPDHSLSREKFQHSDRDV